ncbi:MAG: cytochrome C oxidase subunit II [Gammaproteobacteria bacterium]
MYQALALKLTIVFVGLVMAAFIYVAARAGRRREYAEVQSRAYRIRGYWFWLLVLLGTPVMLYTMTSLPYSSAAQQAGQAQTVRVTGHQWYWSLSQDSVAAGRPVVFEVTSADVNHGMGIYDENMRLVAQTQAMPDYINRLAYTFKQPGDYRLLCLEYCGVAHHNMSAVLHVTAAGVH